MYYYDLFQIAAGHSHFAVVTMEKEVYTWAVCWLTYSQMDISFYCTLNAFFFFLSLCVNDGLSLFSQNVLRKTQDFASEDLYVHVPPDQISFIYIYNVSQKYLCVKNTYLSNLFVLSEHRMYRVVQRKRSLFFQFRLSLFYLCSECTGWFRNCGTAWSWEHIRVQGPQESGGVGRRYTGVLWGGLHFLCLRSAYLFLIHH